MIRLGLLLGFVFVVFVGNSQQNPLLKGGINAPYEQSLYSSKFTHTAFKPTFIKLKKEKAGSNFLESNLITIAGSKDSTKAPYYFILNPAFEFSSALQNTEDDFVPGVGLGINFRGEIKDRLNLGFTFLNYRSKYIDYQRNFIVNNRVSPGVGVQHGVDIFSSNYLSGFINYESKKYFNFELGYGRQFIGDGYRSLLLSDATNASPYFKITTKVWKIKYTNLFASHQNIFNVEGKPELYQRKYTASHFLDWQITKWLSLGLFETIVWQDQEGTFKRGFDPNYLNPIIFYRPIEFSVGSSDNALVGTNIKFTLPKEHIFYFQVVLDEFLLSELQADFRQWQNPDQDIKSGWWANKYGIQMGWKKFDLFKIKGLDTRLEYNFVRPYTYAHSSSTQSYSNYNISLAHPLGANFEEILFVANYSRNKWFGRIHINYAENGLSLPGTNYGENIQLSNVSRTKEYENYTKQGLFQQTIFADASIAYCFQEKWNATVSLGASYRKSTIETSSTTNQFIYLNVKTNLFNRYFDY
ncbi:MAG: hypothetical protein KDB74_00885 [Flavobacteriales bacterium]|nr:hypothetical protein [Flavobacteriales bacterium]